MMEVTSWTGQGQEWGLSVLAFAILATITSAWAWIFNENVEAALGLKGLQALRARTDVGQINSRGLKLTKDPMRLPVTALMGLLTINNWRHNYFETNPYYALLAVFLRLYLVGEMWTRGMPWIFRCLFDTAKSGIRTNYFEPFLMLLEMAFVTHKGNQFNTIMMTLLIPPTYVSLNPDNPVAAIIT